MSIRYKFHDSYATYFVTFSVVEWIDVFTRNDYRAIVVDSICHCISNKGLVVHAWVLMTNHVHLLISLENEDHATLPGIMRDMKKYTAMQLIKNIRENPQESRKEWLLNMFQRAGRNNSNNTNFQFWQQDNHPITIKDDEQCSKVLAYIHNNPVKAGLVDQATDYPWSSARDYIIGKGKIPVAII